MSDWHDELELALLPLEDLRVDSVVSAPPTPPVAA